jgi:DNA-binding NarL/FixJ family response regulator
MGPGGTFDRLRAAGSDDRGDVRPVSVQRPDGHALRPGGDAVRVVIATRVRIYRDGLAQALGPAAGVEVVGSAPSAAEVLAAVAGTAPDVVLLDLAMEERPEQVRALVHRIPVPVVVLGVEERDDDILAWAESGIAGFVTRNGALDDLVAAIWSAARGELLCSPSIAYGMLRRLGSLAARPRPAATTSRVHLTDREIQILGLIDGGLSNKEIARRLGVAISTVKNHVHNILEKLQVVHRHQAVRAVRDWIPDPDPALRTARRD